MEGHWAQDKTVCNAVVDHLPGVFQHASVLYFGDDDRALLDVFTVDSKHVAHVAANDAITLQLDERFDLVVVGIGMLDPNDDGYRRAVLHQAMQHIDRGGHLIVFHKAVEPEPCGGFGADDLQLLGSCTLIASTLWVYRRGDRTTVHDLLFEARSTIRRVSPSELAERIRAADGTLVLDTRTHTDRDRFGVIPGAVHVPRTVVEWHFDPANGYLHPAMRSFDQPLVLVCNGGYSSSLAAANLVRLGFTNVADLIGGHTAWAAAELPVVRPDHSYLDTPGFDEQGNHEQS